jgi:hypothetical protein
MLREYHLNYFQKSQAVKVVVICCSCVMVVVVAVIVVDVVSTRRELHRVVGIVGRRDSGGPGGTNGLVV